MSPFLEEIAAVRWVLLHQTKRMRGLREVVADDPAIGRHLSLAITNVEDGILRLLAISVAEDEPEGNYDAS